MRLLYVAGFFRPVKDALEHRFPAEIQRRSIIWIPQIGSGEPDLKRLKELLFSSISKGLESVCVALPRLRGKEYCVEVVASILKESCARSESLSTTIKLFDNARDHLGLFDLIQEFGPVTPFPNPPDTLSVLERWSELNCGGKLIVHPRALRSAKKSRYCDPPLVFRALTVLAEEIPRLVHRLGNCPDAGTSKFV